MRAASLALPLLLIAATPVAAQDGPAPADVAPVESRYDLRAAPPVVVGLTTRRRVRVAQRGAIVTKAGEKDGQQEQLVQQSFELVVEDRVLAVGADGLPDRALRTFVSVSAGDDDPGGLSRLRGVQVLVVRKGGAEVLARPDGSVLDEKLRELTERLEWHEREHHLPDVALVLPAAPVAVGERWHVSAEGVTKLLEMWGEALDPDEVRLAEGTLEWVEVKDGVERMRVAFRLRLAVRELQGAAFDPPADLELVVHHETGGAASHARSSMLEATFRGNMQSEGMKDMTMFFDLHVGGERVIEELSAPGDAAEPPAAADPAPAEPEKR